MSRGPWQYRFTLKDVADAAFLSLSEVERAKRLRRFDPHSLDSVVRWIVQQKLARAGVIPDVR